MRFVVYNYRVKIYEGNSPYETRDSWTTNTTKARRYSSLEDAEAVARCINNSIGDGCWIAIAQP